MCSDSGCLLVLQAWRGGPGERPWDTGSQLCHLCYRQVLCLQCASSPGHAASCCPYSAARCPLRPCTQAAAQALPPDTWPGHGARPLHAAHPAREGPCPHTPLAPPRTLAQKPSPRQHQAHRAANTGAPRPSARCCSMAPSWGRHTEARATVTAQHAARARLAVTGMRLQLTRAPAPAHRCQAQRRALTARSQPAPPRKPPSPSGGRAARPPPRHAARR